MATTWQIKRMFRQADNDLVVRVRYRCTAEAEGNTASVEGRVVLTGDANDPNFIPFANLTEEVAVGWVKDSLGAEEVAAVEAQAQAKLTPAAPSSPTTIPGLPW
tara:strand:+ start:92 stop:403 length:312 start_codon:yes stop_codon:yes gene_type:complete